MNGKQGEWRTKEKQISKWLKAKFMKLKNLTTQALWKEAIIYFHRLEQVHFFLFFSWRTSWTPQFQRKKMMFLYRAAFVSGLHAPGNCNKLLSTSWTKVAFGRHQELHYANHPSLLSSLFILPVSASVPWHSSFPSLCSNLCRTWTRNMKRKNTIYIRITELISIYTRIQ